MAKEELVAKSQNLGGAPKGNVNAMSCGAYSKRLFSEVEREFFETLLILLRLDFPSANQSTLEETAMFSVQMLRAIDTDNVDAMERLSRKMRKHINALKNPAANQSHNITYDEWLDSSSKTMKR